MHIHNRNEYRKFRILTWASYLVACLFLIVGWLSRYTHACVEHKGLRCISTMRSTLDS
jgi:hypothetical protein